MLSTALLSYVPTADQIGKLSQIFAIIKAIFLNPTVSPGKRRSFRLKFAG